MVTTAATWPSRSQHSLLASATVKADWPSDEAYRAGAARLGLEVEILKAFAKVEAGAEGGFLDSGEPLLLFERHHFHRLTKGKYAAARVDSDEVPPAVSFLSSPKPGGYGTVALQHKKLAAASKLDKVAAQKASSWGLFQILGSNHEAAGHPTLQGFINAMYESADAHLAALVSFIEAHPKLHAALKIKAWTPAAEIYNGPKQRGYDKRFRLAYTELRREAHA